MIKPQQLTEEIFALPSYHPLPGIGVLTINGFVLKAAQPVLVDTGTTSNSENFLAALGETIDIQSLSWIWMTHTDADHIGSIQPLLQAVPHLKVVTNYTGFAKMSTFSPIPIDRVQLLNPGQTLDLGDRTVTAFRPPLYDAPETMGFFDRRSRVLFTADCFGSILPERCEAASSVPESVLCDGLVLWTAIDTPWVSKLDRSALASEIDAIRRKEPSMILSGHLSGAGTMVESLLSGVLASPDGVPFVGHDHETLQALFEAAVDQAPS